MSEFQFIITQWLMTYGFSVGIGDCVCNEDTLNAIKSEINATKNKVKSLIQDCQRGKLENRQPGKSLLDFFESKVNAILADVRNTAGKIAHAAL